MEVIKKTIKQAVTTGTTDGIHTIIVPDPNAIYYLKISLSQANKELGFFDAYDFSGISGTILPPPLPYLVTGASKSRIDELKKFTISGDLINQYKQSFSSATDGVNPTESQYTTMPFKFVYYIGGISYIDIVTTSGTTTEFSFNGNGCQSANFINKPIYKDPNKENIVQNPKIDNDVFIERQELSGFDKNYKLEFIENLVDLETYAAGNFFNIVNNT